LVTQAQGLGRKLLAEVAIIGTPETLLAWHRQLIDHRSGWFSVIGNPRR